MEWLKWVVAILIGSGLLAGAIYLWHKDSRDESEDRSVGSYSAWGLVAAALGVVLLPLDWWHWYHVGLLTIGSCFMACGARFCYLADIDKKCVDEATASETKKIRKKEHWKNRQHSVMSGAVMLMTGSAMLFFLLGTEFMPGDVPGGWWGTFFTAIGLSILAVGAHFFKWTTAWWWRWLVAPLAMIVMVVTMALTVPALISQADDATTSVTEVEPPPDIYETTEEDMDCSQDSLYFQRDESEMAKETPPDVVLAQDVDVLAHAAYSIGLREHTGTEDLLTEDGACLNEQGIALYDALIAEIDVIDTLQGYVDAYRENN